jgi:formylglycine-generating enzyme required for sulfatase activity
MKLRYLKTVKFAVTATAALCLLFLAACGDGSDTADKTVSIAISPTSKNVELGESVELTINAKNTAIAWPNPGEVEGSFTVSGNKVRYVPPSVIGTYRFTVAAEANKSKTVTARITVVYASPEIEISPTSPETKVGKTVQFTATYTIPTGHRQDQEPEWEVSGSCGTVDENGLFSAAMSGDCVVRASLRDNNNKKITASVTVRVKDAPLSDILGDMVQVRGGTFTRGCTPEQRDCYGNESPAHQVTLNDFHIGSYEVTQYIWKQVMGINRNPSGNRMGDNMPVENVSWNDIVGTSGDSEIINGVTYYANGFIYRLNEQTGKKYRLPTEAEWEYAARGGRDSKGYVYSGSNTLDDVGWYEDNSDMRTYPVGMKTANELGIYDMSGNVDEWVSDFYSSYNGNSLNNPTGPVSGWARVVRGGSSFSSEEDARVPVRGGLSADSFTRSLGFRLAITSTR